MNKPLHSISVHFARTLSEAAQRAGLDHKTLLIKAGLHEKLLENPKIRITPEQMSKLTQEFWRVANDEFMCLTKHPCKLGIFLLMAKQAILCKNLGATFEHIAHFYNLVSNAITLGLTIEDKKASFTIRLTNPELDSEKTFREFLLILWHRFPSWLIGRLIPLQYITLDYPEPDHSQEYHLMYPCPVKYNQPACSLVFDASLLESKLVQAPENLLPYIKTTPEQWFKRQAYYQVYTRRVINLLEEHQLEANFSMEKAANELHITSRTLRRKLLDEGTSFQALKDSARRDRAIHYLSQREMPIARISAILGFTEPAAFTRAFKSWTGVSPSMYRQT